MQRLNDGGNKSDASLSGHEAGWDEALVIQSTHNYTFVGKAAVFIT